MRKLILAALLAFAPPAFAQTAELNVLVPGVVFNSGIQDLAAAYSKQTGVKVTVKSAGMAGIVNTIKTGTPIVDVFAVPVSFMDGLETDGTATARVDLGRVTVGLAVPRGKPHPDVSTPRKLAAALKTGTVLYSNPASGSMEARIINDMLHQHAIFKGVKSKISLKGEGGEALVRGEGDMALQLICEILNHPELELAGPVPQELGAYIDTSVAVSSRSTQADAARAFVAYVTQHDHDGLWKSKGLDRNPPEAK